MKNWKNFLLIVLAMGLAFDLNAQEEPSWKQTLPRHDIQFGIGDPALLFLNNTDICIGCNYYPLQQNADSWFTDYVNTPTALPSGFGSAPPLPSPPSSTNGANRSPAMSSPTICILSALCRPCDFHGLTKSTSPSTPACQSVVWWSPAASICRKNGQPNNRPGQTLRAS